VYPYQAAEEGRSEELHGTMLMSDSVSGKFSNRGLLKRMKEVDPKLRGK
jgi:hypothetical protein